MARIIHMMPLSGGDCKHYARELARTEQLHAELEKKMVAAYDVAHRLACEEWNARRFLGGEADPSPTIAAAIQAGFKLLEVKCKVCRHFERVPLPDLVWPREKPIHTLAKVLFCQECRVGSGATRRPNLICLCVPGTQTEPPKTPARKQGACGS
ncbi:hypothetical protein [Bradyrhizobium guangdongense]|uniref:Uncharacterized protein n=1 Tax=Bradyrhizobium guangdongense TaxID=1325090 RepID=A0A410VCN1_9BRAD|nr:hypothetical protein [Bradyrhizobium guangdongense]QAU41483.1 hypothetical protein X265_30180 [Bradyrhizobium guangdongense]QOZ62545.1 hypothetical protein XH86_30215 [Bradyrhizobium guangdongense]GGI31748.1 hypothetical protein GCM10010987_65960 [Bradyrhizobium guangdongense]